MGLSNLLGSSSSRAAKSKALAIPGAISIVSASGRSDVTAPEYISDADQLKPLEAEPPDLRDLNASLEALAVIFPDVQVEVFRQMMRHFDGESRLHVVADALVKNRVEWVKGRWKAPDKAARQGVGTPVARSEMFRSEDYKDAVKALAYHEFKGLSRSSIDAVLAESNYSYLEAHLTLADLCTKSWRFTVTNLFWRRKIAPVTEAENHPLVIWQASRPCLKPTGNAELDRELFEALVAPLKERCRAVREMSDHRLAVALNNELAEELQNTVECACCFTESPFEEFTSCTVDGHMICFRCVQHSISEAVFGQGWMRSIDKHTGTLVCPAVSSSECQGRIPQDQMLRAMLEEKRGAEMLHKLELRLADHNLLSSGLPLIRCPFCSYAEVDDIYVPPEKEARDIFQTQTVYGVIFAVLSLFAIPLVLPILLTLGLATLVLGSKQLHADGLAAEFREARTRQRRRRRGLRFECRNAECGQASCLSCGKEWVDVHVCNESSLVALRTQVEQAMSNAIKRVCPRCNTSFVKTAGCNKLTCPCGYKMCYVCRKDIGGTGDGVDVGYRHFCDHFRPEGDPRPCTECKRCNLWESENTDTVLEQAKEEAERKWREMEDRELSGAEKAFLETGIAVQRRWCVQSVLREGRWPTIAEVFDFVVEHVYP